MVRRSVLKSFILVSLANSAQIVAECDLELLMTVVLDATMVAHRAGEIRGHKQATGDAVAQQRCFGIIWRQTAFASNDEIRSCRKKCFEVFKLCEYKAMSVFLC